MIKKFCNNNKHIRKSIMKSLNKRNILQLIIKAIFNKKKYIIKSKVNRIVLVNRIKNIKKDIKRLINKIKNKLLNIKKNKIQEMMIISKLISNIINRIIVTDKFIISSIKIK